MRKKYFPFVGDEGWNRQSKLRTEGIRGGGWVLIFTSFLLVLLFRAPGDHVTTRQIVHLPRLIFSISS